MNTNESSRHRTSSISGSLLMLALLLCSSVSNAQSPPNFSGVWIRDTVRSDNFYKTAEVEYTITQTPETFNVKQKFTIIISKEAIIHDYSFTLDGKVKNVESEYGIEKNSVKWSADKKTLTTRSVITYGPDDVGVTETYSLSENGVVLTAVKADIIEGSTPVKMVFNKKK